MTAREILAKQRQKLENWKQFNPSIDTLRNDDSAIIEAMQEFSAQQNKELIEQNQTASSTVEMVQAKYEELESELSKQKEEIEALKKESDRLSGLFLDALKIAFHESRLTHPMIGFKHKDFEEFWQFFKKEITPTLETLSTPEPSEEREGKEDVG